MFLLENRLRGFLNDLESYEPVIELVVSMIPTRVFISDSVLSGVYDDHIDSIRQCVKEGRQGQVFSYACVPYLVKDYDESLDKEADLKRKLLFFDLLRYNQEEQMELIVKMCRDYRLGARLLSRKEDFSYLERD